MKDNICSDCRTMIVLHAFSEGECKICKKKILTVHIPCYELCDECSEENNICKQCGKNEN